jgi:hypothetical protein
MPNSFIREPGLRESWLPCRLGKALVFSQCYEKSEPSDAPHAVLELVFTRTDLREQ